MDVPDLKQLLDDVPFGVHYYELMPDRSLIFNGANEAADRVLGIANSQFVGKSIEEAFPPLAATEIPEAYRRVAETGEHFATEQVIYDHDDISGAFDVRAIQLGPGKMAAFFTDITDRKRMELALQKERDLVTGIMGTSPVGIVMVNADGKITFANSRAEYVLGLGNGDLTRRAYNSPEWKITDHYGNPFFDAELPFVRVMRSKKPVYDVRHAIQKEDGRRVLLSINAAPLFGEKGEFQGMVSSVEDVTAEMEAERENILLAQTVKSVKDCISVTDLEDNIIFVNDAFVRTYGFSEEELLGNKISMVRSASVPTGQAKEIFASTKKESWHGEVINQRKDGTEFPIEVWTSLVRDSVGTPMAMVGVARDIAERKRAQEALRESEERYREFIESARDAIFTLSADGVITSLNRAFETLTGWSRGDWVGRSFTDLVHPDDLAPARQILSDVLQGRSSPVLEFRTKKKDGTYTYGEFTVTPQMKENAVVGILGIARDISQRKVLEEQVRQAQKMESIGMLAGGVAHDFNNILNIILGHATLVKERNDGFQVARQRADVVMTAALRGADLVRQLLTFARKTSVKLEPIQLNDVVRETTKLLEETLPRTVSVGFRFEQKLPAIEADGTQIRQVVLNLCLNARDAMPKGGNLSFTTSLVGKDSIVGEFPLANALQYVCLEVADTGFGMDQEIRKRIFDPFFTTKGPGKGTGLGLSVVFGIMETHRGFIGVESEVDAGTRFRLYFPVHQEEELRLQQSAEEFITAPGGTETLLFVEDEDAWRELVGSLLGDKGYKILVASNGEEALKIYSQHREEIALVVSDFGLPKFDGEELFHRIRELTPDALFIIATGFIEPSKRQALQKAGVKSFIQKPYFLNEILKQIRNVLDGVSSL